MMTNLGFHPINDEDATFCQQMVHMMHGSDISENGFSLVSNPISLERCHLRRIVQEDYMVSAKADGERFILLLCVLPRTNENIAVLMGRNGTFYEIHTVAPSAYFKHGCLLDGELVELVPPYTGVSYLCFDAIQIQGRSLLKESYQTRLMSLKESVCSFEIPTILQVQAGKISGGNLNPCDFNIAYKPCNKLSDLGAIWAAVESGTMQFMADGLILTPVNEGICKTGTNYNTFKWKPVHTIDILLRQSEIGSYDIILGVPPNTIDTISTPLRYSGDIWKCLVEPKDEVLSKHNTSSGPWQAVVECECIVNRTDLTIMFVPVRMRPDKQSGNGLYTVTKTLANIEEQLQLSEIIMAASNEKIEVNCIIGDPNNHKPTAIFETTF